MKSTTELKKEHEGIREMLGILGKVCDRLESGKSVSAGDLERMLDFLEVFVDRCHHAKEEEFLFPAMEGAGLPTEGSPTAVMRSEHETGRGLLRQMRDSAEGCKGDDPVAKERFSNSARRYTDLLLAHIKKEDGILYPLADGMFDAMTDNKLLEDFERVEEERVGHGRHEAFHRLMEELQRAYRG